MQSLIPNFPVLYEIILQIKYYHDIMHILSKPIFFNVTTVVLHIFSSFDVEFAYDVKRTFLEKLKFVKVSLILV